MGRGSADCSVFCRVRPRSFFVSGLVDQASCVYDGNIFNRKRVFPMFLDALSTSLSRLCEEAGLTYKDASHLCHCSSHHFGNIIRRTSVPNIKVLEGLCNGFGKTPNCLLLVPSNMEQNPYRIAMRVETIRTYRWGRRTIGFPVCPRCDSSLEREFQAYCDRCGQRLSWKRFEQATILDPPHQT